MGFYIDRGFPDSLFSIWSGDLKNAANSPESGIIVEGTYFLLQLRVLKHLLQL